MREIYTADRTVLERLDVNIVRQFLDRHAREIQRLEKLRRYYCGYHDILERERGADAPNNRVVCNHAKEIIDTAAGHFMGNPISYSGPGAERITDWFKAAEIDSVDINNAKNTGIYGISYELVTMSDDESPIPKSYSILPQNTFLVCDNTVEHKPLFAAHHYAEEDAAGAVVCHVVNVYTAERVISYKLEPHFGSVLEETETPNFFGEVPIIEYWNNEERQGDFEQQISLIDAYDTLMSDRVNDKEEFVDAILVLINAMLGDTPEERVEAAEQLKRNRLIELPSESDARYLLRTFDEAGVDILRRAIEQDIHKFSSVPCLSDENFAGNASGVSLEYKLLGLEDLTKIKERYYTKGLKRRIALYTAAYALKGEAAPGNAEPVFSRGLPKNVIEMAQVVQQLGGEVPNKLLLAQLPFIRDVDEAMEQLAKEKSEKAKQQRDSFGIVANKPPDGEDDEE